MSEQTGETALAKAKTPTGGQRFYPPGQHPATSRLRAQLARLQDHRDTFGETPEIMQAIDWYERQLATFEAGEERAKRDYLRSVSGGRDG